MFVTLGNLAVEPRCGALVPDWNTGGLLQLTGTVEPSWVDGRVGAVPAGVDSPCMRWPNATRGRCAGFLPNSR